MELDFDPAILIGMDLFARGSDHNRGLGSLNHRLGSSALRSEGLPAVNRLECAAAVVSMRRIAGGIILIGLQSIVGRDNQVFPILVLPRVVG